MGCTVVVINKANIIITVAHLNSIQVKCPTFYIDWNYDFSIEGLVDSLSLFTHCHVVSKLCGKQKDLLRNIWFW